MDIQDFIYDYIFFFCLLNCFSLYYYYYYFCYTKLFFRLFLKEKQQQIHTYTTTTKIIWVWQNNMTLVDSFVLLPDNTMLFLSFLLFLYLILFFRLLSLVFNLIFVILFYWKWLVHHDDMTLRNDMTILKIISLELFSLNNLFINK